MNVVYEIIFHLVVLATTNDSTVYGFGEWNCGDIGFARPCSLGAITASGEVFDPDLPSAAIPAPTSLPMAGFDIGLRVAASNGPCVRVRVNDKSNPRFIGQRGFDFSPSAVRALTGNSPTKTWGGRVELCALKEKIK